MGKRRSPENFYRTQDFFARSGLVTLGWIVVGLLGRSLGRLRGSGWSSVLCLCRLASEGLVVLRDVKSSFLASELSGL
jgi:hypothetical protein